MKKYFIIIVLTLLLAAFSGVALSETITVRSEVLQEKQQENSVTSNVEKSNRLSSKRTKDKADSNITNKGTDNKKMIKYKKFNDGEGELKNKQ
jgi:uncharacterized protein YcfL